MYLMFCFIKKPTN